jgi:hypothetical protein
VTDEIVPVHPISVIGELEDQLLGYDVAIAFIIAAATPVGTLPYMTAPVLGEPWNLPPLRPWPVRLEKACRIQHIVPKKYAGHMKGRKL